MHKVLRVAAAIWVALVLGFAGMAMLEGRLAEIDKVYGPQ